MRNYHRISLVILLSLTCVGAAAAQATPPTPAPDFVFPAKGTFHFIAYGDVRFTDPANPASSNPQYRRALVAQIAKEKPKALVFVGDLVRKGSEPADWEVMTKETAPWREAGIPLLPIIGNHETWGDPQAVNYLRRFPELKDRHWYTARVGNCLFLMLESEPNKPGSEQWNWMEQQLQQVPADVDYVFLVMHHPPYTRSADNAKGGGHSVRAEEQQLAALLEAREKTLRKPIIVLAGHVHSYERYEHGGVTYIVTGGGGATPYEIPRQPTDFYRDPGPAYHFCRFAVGRGALRFQMVKLEFRNGKPRFKVRDSFQLRKAKARSAAAGGR